VPTLTREDPRYYTLGRGGFVRRTGYSISRLFVTRTDGGGRSPNISEIVGNGAAAGIANLYYPSQDRTWTKTGQRWLTQVGLDTDARFTWTATNNLQSNHGQRTKYSRSTAQTQHGQCWMGGLLRGNHGYSSYRMQGGLML